MTSRRKVILDTYTGVRVPGAEFLDPIYLLLGPARPPLDPVGLATLSENNQLELGARGARAGVDAADPDVLVSGGAGSGLACNPPTGLRRAYAPDRVERVGFPSHASSMNGVSADDFIPETVHDAPGQCPGPAAFELFSSPAVARGRPDDLAVWGGLGDDLAGHALAFLQSELSFSATQ